MRKKKFFVLFIMLLLLILIGCSNSTQNIIRIGVTDIADVSVCEKYLKQHFPNENFEVIELNSGRKDSFESVYNNIEKNITSGYLDMVVGIPEGYITSQDQTIFDNLYNKLELNNLLPAVINHCQSGELNTIPFLTHTFYCTRFLIVNKSLLESLEIESKDSFDAIDDVIDFSYLVDEKIKEKSLKQNYSISMGSPNDEFLYDDLANILLPLGFARTEKGLQQRYFDETYIKIFKKLYICAIENSYSRNDIGYTYPLDYYFATGNVAMKVSTSFELSAFKNQDKNSPFATEITDFDYAIVPVSNILNTQSTVSAISAKSKKKEICISVLEFLISEDYAVDIIQNESPFLIDTCSLPCIITEKTKQLIDNKYGIKSLNSYTNYTTFNFAMNSNVHWNVLEDERSCFSKFYPKNVDALIEALQKIK